MAYKFQLGKAKLSGSIETAQAITSQGGLTVAGAVALDAGEINNVELEHSSITIAGHTVSLGGSQALSTDDIGEGSNLYYTDARWDSKMDAASTSDLAEGSNLYWTVARGESMFDTKLAAASTTDLVEGDNLYFTEGRVRSSIASGDGLTYDGASGTFAVTSSIAGAGLAWNAGVLSVDTAEIAAGLSGSVEAIVDAHVTGQDFITYSAGAISVDASAFTASFDAVLGARDTGDLAEGSNLYFTDARAKNVLSVVDAGGDGSLSYDTGTGEFTYTGPSAEETQAHFTSGHALGYAAGQFSFTGSTDAVVEGSSNLYYTNARARNAVSAAALSGLTYDGASGTFAVSSSIAGEALGFTGGVLNVLTDNSSVEVFSDALRVKSSGINNSMLAGGISNDKLVNSSVTVVAGNGLVGGGSVALGGSITLNVSASTGNAIVVMNDGIDLANIIDGSRTFNNDITIKGNLIVEGSTFSASVGTLLIEDSNIVIADGRATYDNGAGLTFGWGDKLQTAQLTYDGSAHNALTSSLPFGAPVVVANKFYGALVGSMNLGIATVSANATISENVTKAMANVTLTLPTSPVVGQEHRVKCFVDDLSSPAVVVAAQVGATIEGVSQVVLESYGAAVSLVWDGSMWMVF